MKKFIVFFIFLILLALTAVGLIFREDLIADYKDAFPIKPSQYFGTTVDMSQILPESNHYVLNNKGEDLIDIAAKLGMNTLRITNITSPTDQKVTESYTHEQWKEVLSKMRRKGIYAVILVESNSTDPKFFSTEIDDSYQAFVRHYVIESDLCSFSNILAIDIRNEPLLDENNLSQLRSASKLVKSACPTAQITIGSWKLGSNWHDPKGAALIKDFVDLYAVHIYGYDKKVDNDYPDPSIVVRTYLHELKKYSGNKPIIIEEFGVGNGSVMTDQNTLGSQALQESAYKGVLQTVHDMKNQNLVGAISYLLLSRNGEPDGWSIAENRGNILLPAAYTFKEYSNN